MRNRKAIIIFLALIIGILPLSANDNLLLANTPITYGEEAFMQRISQRTGGAREPIGLVLSGGSARALAHIGVLKYLEENEIVPDFIISNSMGSIVALLYSAGLSPDQILEVCSGTNISELFAVALPINKGMLDCGQFKAYVKSFLGDGLKLEELEIPVMVICEDLVTKRQIHIAEGYIEDVMTASFAIPFYFDSVQYKDHLLIDGGQTNIAPLEVAFKYSPFNIVSTTFYNNTALNLKNPMTALSISIDIGKTRQGITDIQKHSDDSIWIRCDVEGFSYMQFRRVAEIAAKGYESAMRQMQAPENEKKLAALPHSGISTGIMAKREEIQGRIDRFKRTHQYYNHVGTDGLSSIFIIGGLSYAFPGDPYLLRDDIMLGFRYDLKYHDADLRIVAGLSCQAYTLGPAVPSIGLDAKCYLLDVLRLETILGFFKDMGLMSSPYSPICYFSQNALYTVLLDKVRLELKGAYELVNNFNSVNNRITAWDGLAHLATASAAAEIRGAGGEKGEGLDLYCEFGINLPIWGNTCRMFGFGTLRSEFNRPESYFLASASCTGRVALDGKGNVPFFIGDGFRTKSIRILRQGSPASEFDNPQNLLLSATLRAGVNPNPFQDIAMGELMLISDSAITGYCDFLWSERGSSIIKTMTPQISVGLEFKTNVSLIGLRTISVNLYAGYDGSCNDIIGGLWFSAAE